MVFLDLEAAVVAGDGGEAGECLVVEVQVVWEGDVLDVTQPDRHPLHVQRVATAAPAQLALPPLLLKVQPRHQLPVPVPHLEHLPLLPVLLLPRREQVVLLHLDRPVDLVAPEGVGGVLFEELPVVGVEGVLVVVVVAHLLLLLFGLLFKLISGGTSHCYGTFM